MDNLQIESLRNTLIEKLKELRDMTIERNLILHQTTPQQKYVSFDDPQLLKTLVFREINGSYTFALPEDLWKLIDFTNVSFDDVLVSDIDFTGSKGVKLNIQKIAEKSLKNTKLSGVKIIGLFNDVNVIGTDFTGCISKIPLNPQVVKNWDLAYAKLNGIKIEGSFTGVCVIGTDFTGSTGAVINPQLVAESSLRKARLSGVEVKGSLDDVVVIYTDFTGSKKARINPQKVKDKSLYGTILTDAEIIGSLDGIDIEKADFTGAIMTAEKEYNYAKEEINKSFQKVMKNNKVNNN